MTPPITPRPHGVVAFVGRCVRGPLGRAVPVGSWAAFERLFGGLHRRSALARAVQLFFVNGGRRAWVVRAGPSARRRVPAGDAPEAAALTGRPGTRSGLRALEDLDEFDLLCLPGVADADVLAAAVALCGRRAALLLVDVPAEAADAAAAVRWRDARPALHSRDAAAWFPWLRPAADAGSGAAACAPSGAVAGVIARTDEAQGPWRAPAGIGAILHGVQGPVLALGEADLAALGAAGLNALRRLDGVGPVAWGARTLQGAAAADGADRYLPMRRLVLHVAASVERSTRWTVFESAGTALCTRLRAVVDDFLLGLWRQGALQGARAEQAWFVHCRTAPDAGVPAVDLVIGLALAAPAEFAVLTLRLPTAA